MEEYQEQWDEISSEGPESAEINKGRMDRKARDQEGGRDSKPEGGLELNQEGREGSICHEKVEVREGNEPAPGGGGALFPSAASQWCPQLRPAACPGGGPAATCRNATLLTTNRRSTPQGTFRYSHPRVYRVTKARVHELSGF